MATERSDLARQITVTASLVVCIVGSMIGVGVFGGTPIAQAAGGALAADSTLLAPATPAFSIWSVVYTGLLAYTVWQWLPSQRTNPRQRSLGWIVAVSMILNAAWILSVQAGWLLVSVVVILALLVTLVLSFLRYSQSRAASWIEAVVVDGTLGLYLGWTSAAVCANIAAALKASGFAGFGLRPEFWSVAVLVVVAAVGVALAIKGHGRLALAAAIAWGLAWITVGRSADAPESFPTAIAAAVAAALVLGAAITVRTRVVLAGAGARARAGAPTSGLR
ncbi:TspO/MBR family protein [Arthrobacter sp. StoSoilB20]|uniref:TspO/MBR family protein n=1 Tax=Arthrobacter sp. StoSoilB20 TaxID=2830995 RepID=UPI001CC3748A|nr:TspO/MBR family protein [Arthrobacter sp. StoSoilB20]BCW57036.1 tryptophan-rich sensory protein [Arthrobacter sp. StoSoilB20]